MKYFFLSLMMGYTLNICAQDITPIDSIFRGPLVKKIDAQGYRMLITMEHVKSNKVDTLYHNTEGYAPVYLHFIKRVDDSTILMLEEDEFMISGRVYKFNSNGHWEYRKSKSLATKSLFFSTTVDIIDYYNIKIRNQEGDFLWHYDNATESLQKMEIKSEKH